MDWSHTAICCYTIYVWQVTQYGNIAYLANSPFSFAIDPAMTVSTLQLTSSLAPARIPDSSRSQGIVAFVVQAFYAYRVFVVAKRKVFFPIVIVSLSLISMGSSSTASLAMLMPVLVLRADPIIRSRFRVRCHWNDLQAAGVCQVPKL